MAFSSAIWAPMAPYSSRNRSEASRSELRYSWSISAKSPVISRVCLRQAFRAAQYPINTQLAHTAISPPTIRATIRGQSGRRRL